MSKYKIKGTGLDTTTLNYIPRNITEQGAKFDYFYTNPSANNGLVIRPLINAKVNTKLITGLNFLDSSFFALQSHLIEINRPRIDILMFDAECKFEEFEESILNIQETEIAEYYGIKNPEKLPLDKLKEYVGRFKISCLGINLCPLYFNKEILDWAEEAGLQIISFNPLGGYINAPSLIEAFSIPYLLNFSSVYSDVVMLSGKDITFSEVNSNYLSILIDKEIQKESLYKIKKNINKLIKPLKTVSKVSLIYGEERFPVNEPDSIFNPDEIVVSLINEGESTIINTEIEIAEDDIPGKQILKYLEDAYIPKDTTNIKDHMAVLRPNVINRFNMCYPSSQGWMHVNVFLGDIYLFTAMKDEVKKHWFAPNEIETISHTYLLYYSEGTGFVLRKIQNSRAEGQDS